MGRPNTALVLPAVMFLNPGLSKDELAGKLLEIGGNKWVGREGRPSERVMYCGLYGLGKLLGLERNLDLDVWFSNFSVKKIRNGVEKGFQIIVCPYVKDGKKHPIYIVKEQIGFSLKKMEPVYKSRRYSSIEDLAKDYPELQPASLFDFNQTVGGFQDGYISGGWFYIPLLWKSKDGKYFLDKDSFKSMPKFSDIGIRGRPVLGMNDFMLTSVIVGEQLWDFLSDDNLLGPVKFRDEKYQKLLESSKTSYIDRARELFRK